MHSRPYLLLAALALTATPSYALDIDINSVDSISAAAKTIAARVVAIYGIDNQATGTVGNGSTAPGIFPDPYYWWESGLAWDSMVRYWALTGDATYNDLVREGLLFQIGPNANFTPPNQTKSEGNDDQATWALAAMTAAENNFPAPPEGLDITWAKLAQNVFDSQVARWDTDTCGGGLRWQIFSFNTGYTYKNSLSNGNLVQLAARLALYTGNTTYRDWAQKATQWSLDVGFIGNSGQVWDGTATTTNCSEFNHIQWTSSVGTYLSGAAYAANKSSTKFWQTLNLLLPVSINTTFTTQGGVLYEVACEPSKNCDTDQLAFKAVLARALANARDLTLDTSLYHRDSNQSSFSNSSASNPGTPAGSLHASIDAILRTSAQAAAAQCSGGEAYGTDCGSMWTAATWDGTTGLGQELSALEILLANLPAKALAKSNSTSTTGTGSAGNGTATAGSTSGGPSSSSSAGASTTAATSTNGAMAGSEGSTFALVCGLGMAAALVL
ncbi:hypothetical protein B0A55_04127 [Friedmanniomyces simplex]|uniref:Mannan endo-1,6-alpha-mannosidase n=1 Tax=Friedmanniomyces simplex TaxID=329884 RepID=A0A4U0XQA8_9PEZI|nr:hypothetical protein B0A55_04127 [Friedmanniomyces simplex]